MQSLSTIKRAIIVVLFTASYISAQSLTNFIGQWTGLETLETPSLSYSNRNISIQFSEGGERTGFLIFNSSSDFLYNSELSWSYHYLSYDKDLNQLVFLRRFVAPIGILNEELRYNIIDLTEDSFIAEHYSVDGHNYHRISMHINVLDLIDVQPSQFKLNQNFPNPFNPSTSISVEIERDSFGSLIIYNINGQIVNILNVGYFKAGVTQFKWNGLDISGNAVSGGTYIYRLEIDGLSQSHKMVLLK